MANVRVLLGQFMRHRDRAEQEDRPLAPGGQIDRKDSFLELALPNPDLVLGSRHEVPLQPAPPLDSRHEVGTQGPPDLGKPSTIAFEPPPPLRKPSDLKFQPAPPPGSRLVLRPQKAPPPGAPGPLPRMPPPPLGSMGDLPEPPPFRRGRIRDQKHPAPPTLGKRRDLDIPPSSFIKPGRKPTVLALGEPFKQPASHSAGGSINPAQDSLSVLKATDSRVVAMLQSINDTPTLTPGIQGSGELDPLAFARSVKRAADNVGAARIAFHGLVQSSLYARNINVRGGIDSIVMSKAVGWNPGSLFPLPGMQLFTATTIDGAILMNMGREGRDEITRQQSEAVAIIDGAPEQLRNLVLNVPYNELIRYSDQPALGVSALVDDALNTTQLILEPPAGGATNSNLARFPKGASLRLRSIFLPGTTPLGENSSYNPIIPRNPSAHKSALAGAAFTDGVIPVKIKGENVRGFLIKKANQDSKVQDDDAYVPLCFTDLRPFGGTSFRSVFFRPFITSLSEDFTPEWTKASYAGRVDPVATYQGTGRSINLSFMLVSFGPEDVEMIYKKLNWLNSMVYPEYDKDLVYRSGPVVRLRVGDVINADGPNKNKGLPGIIDSLSYDYSDQIWELKKGLKVPRNVVVALTFTVLHDMPVGIGAEGKFGGLGSLDPSTGKYSTPNAGQSSQEAGKSQSSSPEVTEGLKTFRSMGKDPNSANNYPRFDEADLPELA